MKYLQILVLAVVLSVSGSALGSGISGTVLEVRPDTFGGGGVILQIAGTLSGTSNCPFPDGNTNLFFIPKVNPLYDSYFTIALSAQLTERDVLIVGDDTCGGDAPWMMEGVRFIKII